MRLRFPKTARLTRAAEFLRLKRDGVSFHGRFMVLSVLRHSVSSERTRVGIVTSRRVGSAVIRNRVRRRFREMLRADRPQFAPGFWFILVARQRAAHAEFEDLRLEWRELAKRGHLFLSES